MIKNVKFAEAWEDSVCVGTGKLLLVSFLQLQLLAPCLSFSFLLPKGDSHHFLFADFFSLDTESSFQCKTSLCMPLGEEIGDVNAFCLFC